MSEPNEDETSYEVGYKKPPRHSRFKPGRSGNPKGKRKQKKKPSFADALHNMYAETLEVSINGKRTCVTRKEWLVERLGLAAAKGNVGALNQLLDLYEAEDFEEQEPEVFEVTETEARALGPR